jgi:hypothetical protein
VTDAVVLVSAPEAAAGVSAGAGVPADSAVEGPLVAFVPGVAAAPGMAGGLAASSAAPDEASSAGLTAG